MKSLPVCFSKTILIFLLVTVTKPIFSQICGVDNPQKADDCLIFSSKNQIEFCCFAKIYNYDSIINVNNTNSTNMCILIPASNVFLTPFITSMNIGTTNQKLNLDIDCGDSNLNLYSSSSTCGPLAPSGPGDCQKFSTLNNTCCYLSTPENTTMCLFNNSLLKKNQTINGINIICNGKCNVISYIVYLTLIFLIL